MSVASRRECCWLVALQGLHGQLLWIARTRTGSTRGKGFVSRLYLLLTLIKSLIVNFTKISPILKQRKIPYLHQIYLFHL